MYEVGSIARDGTVLYCTPVPTRHVLSSYFLYLAIDRARECSTDSSSRPTTCNVSTNNHHEVSSTVHTSSAVRAIGCHKSLLLHGDKQRSLSFQVIRMMKKCQWTYGRIAT